MIFTLAAKSSYLYGRKKILSSGRYIYIYDANTIEVVSTNKHTLTAKEFGAETFFSKL